MIRFSFFFLLILLTAGYRVMSPISNYIIEAQKKDGARYDSKSELRHHLHEVVKEAFSDAITSSNSEDEFNQGIAESEQKIILLGERISGAIVSNFCGSLANQQYFPIPVVYREGVHFKPTKQIPIPITNLTINIPSRWFRDPLKRYPMMYVCYEGNSFLKMYPIEKHPEEWQSYGKFRKTLISNPYNDRCRIREILVVLDDFWNKRNLLPRNLEARALLETTSLLPRVTFTSECDPGLGLDQPCCLWKFHFDTENDGQREFHRCFGNIPSEAVKSTQISEPLAELLLRGKMTRRFLTPPTRVCREIEFKPMVVRRPDGIFMTMNRLDATKCGAIF